VLEHVFASTSQVDQDQLVKGKDISGGFMFQFAPDLGGTHAADMCLVWVKNRVGKYMSAGMMA
jgi:hypothetical protein